MFDVEWPPLFTAVIEWSRAYSNLMLCACQAPAVCGLESPSVLSSHLHIWRPLGLIVMLWLPVFVAKYMRRLHRCSKKRMRETVDRFCTNLMFLLFLVYPALSMATMVVFNCDPNVGRLREDYRLVCPHVTTSVSLYSTVFFVLYAFGIPVAMHVSLRHAGIRRVVEEKRQQAEVGAMLSLFIKLFVSVEMQRFARLIGNVDGDETKFQAHAREQFDFLVALQDDDSDTLKLSKLKEATAGAEGMEGTSVESILKLLEQYDVNGDGETDFGEFCTLLKESRARANLFTGSEDVNVLSDKQMDTLLLFHGWPTEHEGPGDVGESEGMGGMGQMIDQNAAATANEDDDDEEERAHRQANIADGGDRSDPELERIDELKKELLKREEEGHMSEWYMCPEHGWRKDIKQAEDIYVDNPAKVDAFLETIHVKELPTDEKRSRVLELARRLVVSGITATPRLVWSLSTGETEERAVERTVVHMLHVDQEEDVGTEEREEDVEPPKDQLLMNRFGFLFIAYRIEFWWWEGVEMFRKFLMTSLLVFVMPGEPGQLAAAAMITFCFLIMNLMYQPFCTAGLNSLSSFTLIAQFATLVSQILRLECPTRASPLQCLLYVFPAD